MLDSCRAQRGEPDDRSGPEVESPRCVECGRAGVVAVAPCLDRPIRSKSMTAAQNSNNQSNYLARVLALYVQLPDTPAQANAQDRRLAQQLMARGVPEVTVATALLLASLRRLVRDHGAGSLPGIRSLAYFLPVIEELSGQPARPDYLAYLQDKLRAAVLVQGRP